MTKEEYKELADKAFVGYTSIVQFGDLAKLYGHIPDRLYRRSLLLIRQNDNSCVFDNRQHVLLHMISLSAEDDELLTYKEAVDFINEYCNSQLKENEVAVNLLQYTCLYDKDLAIEIAECGYKESVCFEDEPANGVSIKLGGYRTINAHTPLSALLRDHRCDDYVNKFYKKAFINMVKITTGQVRVYTDQMLLNMYASGILLTKKTIMFQVDMVLGHERQHRKQDVIEGAHRYVVNNWKPVYGSTKFSIVEQSCNRAGLIYAVKQMSKRKKLGA